MNSDSYFEDTDLADLLGFENDDQFDLLETRSGSSRKLLSARLRSLLPRGETGKRLFSCSRVVRDRRNLSCQEIFEFVRFIDRGEVLDLDGSIVQLVDTLKVRSLPMFAFLCKLREMEVSQIYYGSIWVLVLPLICPNSGR
jgi:hypothetical protein